MDIKGVILDTVVSPQSMLDVFKVANSATISEALYFCWSVINHENHFSLNSAGQDKLPQTSHQQHHHLISY